MLVISFSKTDLKALHMKIIGLMSGTSADGIDVALCEVHGAPPHLKAEILYTYSHEYSDEMRDKILRNCQPQLSRVDEICRLNVELAESFAEAILEMLQREGIDTSEVDLIGSHGHTLWHEVIADGTAYASLQIVEASVIAERTGITTISNLRARDIAAGGQGAPLTGYVDYLLLRHPTRWRAIQNIGGLGNVTFLPPLTETHKEVITFDTGPGNALLDSAVLHFTDGKQSFDRDSLLAKQGQIDEVWLDNLLQHEYYQRSYPKSTGRELFGTEMALNLIQEAQKRGLNQYDTLATITALTATSIVDAYRRFAPASIEEVILGGGGYRNPMMVELMKSLFAPTPVLTHEDIGISSDFKEALVFAVLAHETWHGRIGTLPSLTGASHGTVLGQITPGKNYAALLKQLKI